MARQSKSKAETVSVDQLELFDCFGLPAFPCDDYLSLVPDHTSALPSSEVMAYASNDADDSDDDPLVTAPVIRRIVSAAEAAPLPIRGPVSIFDMNAAITVRMERRQDGAQFRRVVRDAGVTRCVRILEQDTAEWQEREAARRARQRPPKPTAKAKTKSRKLLELVGA